MTGRGIPRELATVVVVVLLPLAALALAESGMPEAARGGLVSVSPRPAQRAVPAAPVAHLDASAGAVAKTRAFARSQGKRRSAKLRLGIDESAKDARMRPESRKDAGARDSSPRGNGGGGSDAAEAPPPASPSSKPASSPGGKSARETPLLRVRAQGAGRQVVIGADGDGAAAHGSLDVSGDSPAVSAAPAGAVAADASAEAPDLAPVGVSVEAELAP